MRESVSLPKTQCIASPIYFILSYRSCSPIGRGHSGPSKQLCFPLWHRRNAWSYLHLSAWSWHAEEDCFDLYGFYPSIQLVHFHASHRYFRLHKKPEYSISPDTCISPDTIHSLAWKNETRSCSIPTSCLVLYKWAYLHEYALWRRRFSIVIVSPARNCSIPENAASMKFSTADLSEIFFRWILN